jgi:hypothetical protein
MNKIRVIDALLLPFSKYLSDQRLPKESALRISVLSSGRILLEGKKATLAKVKKALAKAQSARNPVWYYRESGKGEPPIEAIEIVKLVVEHKLSIGLSSEPDFSDYIDDEGRSHPRE